MSTESWADGYVTDIEYNQHFFGNLAPAHLDYVCLQVGQRPPAVGEPFTYCELGCGLGLSSTVLAAANPQGRFWAADLNPNHVATARQIVQEAQLDNVTHMEASFAEMLDADLPEFDYIVFHGVWTWVSTAARRDIVRFIRRKLKTGGTVYVSYNTAVGWERRHALGRMFKELVEASHGQITTRIGRALEILKGLVEDGSGYFADNEEAKSWVQSASEASPHYLAHEYLNDTWQLFFHSDVVKEMADAKLTYVGSTDVLRNYQSYQIRAGSKAETAVEFMDDPVITELIKDMASNWGLRRDVYRRGTAQSSPTAWTEMAGGLEVCLVGPIKELENACEDIVKETSIHPKIVDALSEVLREGPCTIEDIGRAAAATWATLVSEKGEEEEFGPEPGLRDMLLFSSILLYRNTIAPIPFHECTDGGDGARRLNRVLSYRTVQGESFGVLAAPLIGSATPLGDLASCCYHRIAEGHDDDPVFLAQAITEDLARIDRKPTFDGEEATEERFVEFCQEVLDDLVPIWRKMGVL